MNPLLSWTLFFGIVVGVYIGLNGVPKSITRALRSRRVAVAHDFEDEKRKADDPRTTITQAAAGGSKKKTAAAASAAQKSKRQKLTTSASRSDAKTVPTAAAATTPSSVSGDATPTNRSQASQTDDKPAKSTAQVAQQQQKQKAKPAAASTNGQPKQPKVASWYSKDNATSGTADDVEHVPALSDSTLSSDHDWTSVSSRGESAFDAHGLGAGAGAGYIAQKYHDARKVAHSTDDMLDDPHREVVAKTLRITGQSQSTQQQQAGRQSKSQAAQEQPLTKKQRQNAAKKAKAQAERDALREEQEKALLKHKRALEARRLAELTAAKPKSAAQLPATVWHEPAPGAAPAMEAQSGRPLGPALDANGNANSNGSGVGSSVADGGEGDAFDYSAFDDAIPADSAIAAEDQWEAVSGKKASRPAPSTGSAANGQGTRSGADVRLDNNRFGKLIWE